LIEFVCVCEKSVCAPMCICLFVCVCVRERSRARETETEMIETERQTDEKNAKMRQKTRYVFYFLKASVQKKTLTKQKQKQHNTSEDAWTVFRGKVYDCTSFFEYHPGGAKFMLAVAGKDGTKLFDKYHTWVNVDFIMEKCLIGLLKEDDVSSVALNEDDEDDDDESERSNSLQLSATLYNSLQHTSTHCNTLHATTHY